MSRVFDGVSYYLTERNVRVPSDVKRLMRSGGATREFYPSEMVTHVICDSPMEASITAVFPTDAIILHSDWVRMSSKCGAILPTVAFELRDDKLFSGLVFCTSKLPRSDMEKLCVLVAYYGGRTQQRLDSNVTHLVTMEMRGAKYECATRHSVKVVTPDWLLDSIELGKRLEESDYHPSSLQLIRGEVSPTCNGDKSIGPPTPAGTKVVVTSGVVQNIPCEIVLDKTSSGEQKNDVPTPEKMAAVSEPPPRATSEEHVVVTIATTAIASKETKTTTDHSDDLSSSPGNVLVSLPATTESKSPGNVLVSLPATTEGKPLVSCPLEDTTLLQGLAFYFTDYQDCMDTETIDKWKEVVVQHGGEVLSEYDSTHCTHLLALHKKSEIFNKAFTDGKCIASAHWLNEVLTEQKMFPPRNALHFPTAFKWQLPGAENYSLTLTNYTDSERDVVKDMIKITGIPYTGYLCRDTTHVVCKSPSGKKYEKAVEWGVHVVNASFLADIIHNGEVPVSLLPGHTSLGSPDEFSNSCLEAVRILKPWEPFMSRYSQDHAECVVDMEASQEALQSLSLSKRQRTEEGGEKEGEQKRARLSETVDNSGQQQQTRSRKPVVVFTGISQSAVKKLKHVVQRLGGKLTDKPRECTHIVAPRVTRTVKFLSAISVCDYVVTPQWVEQSGKMRQFVDESFYTLRDEDTETLFVMDIRTSLDRAKKRKLLKGLCFYSTPNVMPPPESLKEIIECAGGELLTEAELNHRFGASFDNLAQSPADLIVLSCVDDVMSGHCSEFLKHNIAIYNAEFVLTGALRQELDYSLNKITPNETLQQ